MAAISISVDKCCVLNIGQQVLAPYITIKSVLPLVPSVRDLRVVVCTDLSTTAHVADVVAKAHKRANLILRAFVSREINTLVRAYLAYVTPLVEFNSIVWSPDTVKDIVALERVQRRFTKKLPGLYRYC